MGYTYDAAGQRLTGAVGFGADLLPTPTTGTNTFDVNNRQTLWNGFSLGYDANGDPLTNNGSSPPTTYTFDARHRLKAMIQSGSTIASFQYDTFGRRTSKTVGTTTTSFLYDGANPAQETQGSTISAILTGMGIDERYSRVESAGTRYFLTDALGSTLALTDASQAVQQTYSYEPFGEVSVTGSSNNPYQYTGRENDGTGLYYYRVRYYSPSLKRFISEDPTGLAAGLNEYSYALDNPVSFSDPLGLDVDINLFPPSPDPSKPGAYEFAKLYPGNPLECTIAGHGTPFDLAGRSPQQLADLMKNYPQCAGKPIRLLACNTGVSPGRGAYPFGQYFANDTGQNVTAPGDWSWFHSDGSYSVGPTKHHLDWHHTEQEANNDQGCGCGGNWVPFSPH